MPRRHRRLTHASACLFGLAVIASCGGDASLSIRPTTTPISTPTVGTTTATPVGPTATPPATTSAVPPTHTATLPATTATVAPTNTPTSIPTDTETPIPSATAGNTATSAPTSTATPSPTNTRTTTATNTPTLTSLPTSTATEVPSATHSPADTATHTHTAAPSSTPTQTSLPADTPTAGPSPTGGTGAVCGNGILEPGEFVDDPVNGLIGDLNGIECPAELQVLACAAEGSFSFDVFLEPPLGTNPNSITAVVGYRSDRASIPGSGTAGLQRVTFPSPQPFVRSARDFDYAIRVVGIRTGSFPAGPAFSIRFDGCGGQPDPTADDIACTVEGCAGSGGSIVGCECIVVPR